MKVLLTGGNGFVGSWVAKRLIRRGIDLRLFDIEEDLSTLRAIAGRDADATEWRTGDISNRADVERAVQGCDAIIHTAAMLTPACAADPLRGMAVNLGGTLNIFEAAKRAGIGHVIYTSSASVFGPDDPKHPCPQNHYGAFKLAEEGCARAYALESGLFSIGFRPFVVYGPGRKKGLSAGPSFACRAAARGERYAIPFTGRTAFVYVDDVASAYEEALFATPQTAQVFNLAGETAAVDRFIEDIRKIVPSAQISAEGEPLPIAPELEPDALYDVLPKVQRTALRDGVAATIAFYRP